MKVVSTSTKNVVETSDKHSRGGETLRIVILDDEKLVPFSEEQLDMEGFPPSILIHKRSGQYAQEALHRSQGTLPDELTRHLKLSS